MKKPTMLRNLRIRKVDLVDQGANQHAHIQIAKRNDETPEPSAPDERAFFERLGAFITKMFTAQPTEPVAKDAKTFDEVDSMRDVHETMWRILDSLRESIRAIIDDDEVDDLKKAEMIGQTADQAASAIKTDIASIFSKIVSKGDPGNEEGASATQKPGATGTPPATDQPFQKKGATDMIFDTSKMTPEEKATYEDFAKRFGSEGTTTPAAPAAAPTTPAAPAAEPQADDVYKGLHPMVKTELENLRKFREESALRELTEVAKKYTLLGKKPEELAPVLKSLKDAGGTAYADMIGILDSNLATIEKSGVFGEIGKRGNSSTDDAWGKIEAAATEIMKSKADMRWADAIDAACMKHPELVEQYEKARR